MTTPKEVLNSKVEGINAGDLDSLMTLYEADAFLHRSQEEQEEEDNLQRVQNLYAKVYVLL